MRYKITGYLVWKGARWYVRRNYGRMVPSRRVLAASAVVSTVAVLAAVAASRNSDS